jgi:hypothetical protein
MSSHFHIGKFESPELMWLMVEESGVPGETHRPWQATGKLYHLRLRVQCTLSCNLQSRARTHAVLVIGLYELLGNPTTLLIEPPGLFYIN